MSVSSQVVFPMTNKNYFKWYHWFLFPFAKKVVGIDGNSRSYAFIIFGRMFVYKFKEVK
jgi:hypothetical protein